MSSKSLARLTSLITAAATLLWSATAQARTELGFSADEAEATIGCMFPLTGRAAIYGRDSIAAMKLALADLPIELQGTTAPKLRILVEDDRSKASVGVRIAEEFIDRDKVRFLCGIVSSGVAQAVSRLARTRKVILVGTDHASSRLTMEDWHRHYFRVSNDTWTSMAAGARYLAELQGAQGWKKLAYIGPDYDYGHVAWRDLDEALRRLAVRHEVTAQLWPRLYEPDYTAYIARLKAAQPDVIVTSLWGGDFIAFLKQAMAAGLLDKTLLANFDTGGNYDVLQSLGDKPPRQLVVSARHLNNWPDTPRNRRFVDAFFRLEGRYPTYAAEGAYAGVMAMALALATAGAGADKDKLIRTLEGMRLPLPEDPAGFTSYIDAQTHQVVQAQAVGEVVADDRFPPARLAVGKLKVYSAEEIKPPADLVRQRSAKAHGAP